TSSAARRQCRYATSTIVASRWPQRLALAASISCATSASVRYSRVRSSAFGRRFGGPVLATKRAWLGSPVGDLTRLFARDRRRRRLCGLPLDRDGLRRVALLMPIAAVTVDLRQQFRRAPFQRIDLQPGARHGATTTSLPVVKLKFAMPHPPASQYPS